MTSSPRPSWPPRCFGRGPELPRARCRSAAPVPWKVLVGSWQLAVPINWGLLAVAVLERRAVAFRVDVSAVLRSFCSRGHAGQNHESGIRGGLLWGLLCSDVPAPD